MIDVKIKLLSDTAKLPTYGSELAAGADLYADLKPHSNIGEPLYIGPHETVKVGTGIACELPEGYCALIFARSGLATKLGLRPANCVGLCDEDYRGEYIVAIHNDSEVERIVEPGERIAQVVFMPYVQANFEVNDELSDTERGDGGFGSSGSK